MQELTPRRTFLKLAAASGTVAMGLRQPGTLAQEGGAVAGGAAERAWWITVLRRLADPVLENLAAGTLRSRMPVEGPANRRAVTHLEAVGRLLAGIAPWLELGGDTTAEGAARARYANLARRALGVGLDRSSPDALNFTEGGQPLVDAAFLAQAILRAPRALWQALEPSTQASLVAALESTRAIQPGFNNWLLFSATVEAALARMGARWDRVRVDYALRQHEQWYKGDGIYGDGPELHWDYYNSFVIQPMLLDVLDACGGTSPAWQALAGPVARRAQRYAAIQERLIAPDGSWPLVGRSLAYRTGAFQLLAQVALRHALPAGLTPCSVRSALTAAMRRSLEAPGTFDTDGWLHIGVCGHQPVIGERYISTGSLYLCAAVLLPLGLPEADEFWSGPPAPWTSVLAWSGKEFPIDHAG